MTLEDQFAMYELAATMRWPDAAKFIRGEIGESLRDTPPHLDHIARVYPDSVCAISWKQRSAD